MPPGVRSLFEDGGELCDLYTSILQLKQTSRYSILPALCSTGILSVDIIEGSFDSSKFGQFIDGLLSQMNPWPQPNSVIVMDNCRIHKYEEILEMIEARYVNF